MKFIVLAVSVVLIIGGCIYSFNPGGEPIIKTISVKQFENETIQAGLANTVTDLVINALIIDGTLKVVGEDNAEGILIGTLKKYKRDYFTYDEADNVSQYVVKLDFAITLKKGEADEEFWSENFYAEGVYDAIDGTEEAGQELAVEKLVQDIITRTTKSW